MIKRKVLAPLNEVVSAAAVVIFVFKLILSLHHSTRDLIKVRRLILRVVQLTNIVKNSVTVFILLLGILDVLLEWLCPLFIEGTLIIKVILLGKEFNEHLVDFFGFFF